LGSPSDEQFVGCESRLEELSSHVQYAPRNFIDWYSFAQEVELIFYPRKTIGPFLSDYPAFIRLKQMMKKFGPYLSHGSVFYQTVTNDENLGLGPDRWYVPPLHVCT
jgi:hypothetical protein